MKISYAITCKHEYDELVTLLQELQANIPSEQDYEIVVLQDTPDGKHTDEFIQKVEPVIRDNKRVRTSNRKFTGDFAEHKNFLTSLCTGDWVFQIDADEVPDEYLIGELESILQLNDDTVQMVAVPRVNLIFDGTQQVKSNPMFPKWGWEVTSEGVINFPDFQTRIYKRDGNVHWERPVHERLVGYEKFASLPEWEEMSLIHTKQLNKQVAQNTHYNRLMILSNLKATGNWHGATKIERKVGPYDVGYYRWMHPYQGTWEDDSLFTETELTNIKKMIDYKGYSNPVVLDIGAQAGYMSAAYALFANTVYAFEPNSAAYEILEMTAKDIHSNIVPLNYAVSDALDMITFYYSDAGFCNGGDAARLDAGIGVTGHRIPLTVFCVNHKWISENCDVASNVSFIKIDAEGFDSFILREIEPIVRKNRPVIQTEIYDGLTDREKQKLLDILHEFEYTVYNAADSSDIDALGQPVTDISTMRLNSGHNLICMP